MHKVWVAFGIGDLRKNGISAIKSANEAGKPSYARVSPYFQITDTSVSYDANNDLSSQHSANPPQASGGSRWNLFIRLQLQTPKKMAAVFIHDFKI